MCNRSALLFALAALLAPAAATAQWSLFAPHQVARGSEIELFGAREREDYGTDVRRFGWEDTFLKEKLTLFSDGYVYHPRFLQYHVSLSGAFKQEAYDSTVSGDTGGAYSNRGTGFEYDFRFLFLAEHPYNLTLFASRAEPLYRERSALHFDSLETIHGFDAVYRKRPYRFGSRFSESTVDSGSSSSTTQDLTLSGDYHHDRAEGKQVWASALFEPSRFHATGDLHGEDRRGSLEGYFDFGRASSLRSRLVNDQLEQRDPLVGRLGSSQLRWEENLVSELPYRLHAEADWRYDDTSATSSLNPDLRTRSKEVEARLTHHLYQSLTSRYEIGRIETGTTYGDSSTLTQLLGIDYSKRIPRGWLSLSSAIGRTDTDSTGQVAIAQEPHTGVDVPGRFLLDSTDVAAATVAVYVRSPLPPHELVPLSEGIHYTLAPLGNQLEVTVLALPPRFEVPGKFDFVVSYAAAGGFRLRTDMRNTSLGLHLWNDSVYPYYNHSQFRTDVLEGQFPGEALDSTTDAYGLELRAPHVQLRAEHQDVRWNVGPYTAWLGELRLNGGIGTGTSVNAVLSYLTRDYHEGTAVHAAYSETLETGTLTAQQRLLRGRLTLSLGGSYSRLDSLSQTEAWSGHGSLTFRLGLIDITSGATVSRSDSVSQDGIVSRHATDTFFVRIHRTLS